MSDTRGGPAQVEGTLVAVCQLAPVLGDVTGNIERATAAVQSAAAAGAEIVVLPELVTTGYVYADEDELRPYAEPVDGPSISALTEVARETGATVVGGFAELHGAKIYNSAVILDPTGVLAVYRKVHLWDYERELFTPGAGPPPVVDTVAGRIGVVICYDLEFPEWSRSAALDGAQLLCAPTNWPLDDWPLGEHARQLVHAQSAALASRIFVAVCDRTGIERGIDWAGCSGIVGPDGYPIAEATRGGGVQIILGRCDLRGSDDKATSTRNHAFADRHPELYGRLAES